MMKPKITMNSQSRLPEDEHGRRPGHPMPGRQTLLLAEAAGPDWLNTSTTTIRTLLVDDLELDGYWTREGRRYRYLVYRDSVEKFLTNHGPFPAAKHRRRPAATNPSPIPHTYAEHADPSQHQLRVLQLEELVRCQSSVIAKLQAAAEHHDAATEHRRAAEAEDAKSTRLIREAVDEYARLAALEGIPNDPSSAHF
jgi:hypothetical protein